MRVGDRGVGLDADGGLVWKSGLLKRAASWMISSEASHGLKRSDVDTCQSWTGGSEGGYAPPQVHEVAADIEALYWIGRAAIGVNEVKVDEIHVRGKQASGQRPAQPQACEHLEAPHPPLSPNRAITRVRLPDLGEPMRDSV